MTWDDPETPTGREQVTPEQAGDAEQRDTTDATAAARPPLDAASDLSPTLPRPVGVTERFTRVLREHACGWSPCGEDCAVELIARLREQGIMLADFGHITGHDED